MQVAAHILPHGVGQPAHLHAHCHEIFQQAMYTLVGFSIHIRHMARDRYRPQVQSGQKLLELIDLQEHRGTPK